MTASLTHDRFAECLHEVFRVTVEDTSVELALIQVDKLSDSGAEPAEREPFALVFRGPPEPVLAQGLYPFESASTGNTSIFIVPIGPDGEGMRYEAVFN